jgi:predicted O-methyltransferase YrrM
MIKSYNEYSNPNMRRPVVKPEINDFLRTAQKQLTGSLKALEDFAHKENVPIIPHETVVYFQFLLQTMKPEKILEVGTAVGFSALLMADSAPNSKITTIERNPEMATVARANFQNMDVRKQITLLEGDAMDILPTIEKADFDLAFMDSAKSKYIVFLPQVLKRLRKGGVVIIDDVFQGGDVVKPIEEVKRNQRGIYRGLHKLFDAVLNHPDLTASLIPMSDGILMIRKNADDIVLPETVQSPLD